MTVETFASALDRLDEAGLYGSELTILWHGGEPLSVPLAFYQDAFTVASERIPPSCSFRFNFQTNATLITPAFCAFAKKVGAHVGISIDGPAAINDRWRQRRSGAGTHADIMAGIEMLRTANVPFSAIAVLTRESLSQADQIFEFFVHLGAEEVGFNVEEIEGAHRTSTLSPASVSEFRRFMKRIWQRARTEHPPIRFRDLEQLASTLRYGTQVFSRLNNPLSIIAVGAQGDFSTFAPELVYDERFIFGNVHKGGFEEALGTPTFRAALEAIEAGKTACAAQCEYFSVCGGGSPSNKVSENGTAASTQTLHCRLTKQVLTDIVLEELELEYGLQNA